VITSLTSSFEKAGYAEAFAALQKVLAQGAKQADSNEPGGPISDDAEDTTVVDTLSGDVSLELETPAGSTKKSPTKAAAIPSPQKSASPVRPSSTSPIKVDPSITSPGVLGDTSSGQLNGDATNGPKTQESTDSAEHDSIFGADEEEGVQAGEGVEASGDTGDIQSASTSASPEKPSTAQREGGTEREGGKEFPLAVQADADLGYLYTVCPSITLSDV
jgi:hypothetical protein